MQKAGEKIDNQAYNNFIFALRSKESQRQYPKRLDPFLSFVGLAGTIEEKCIQLYEQITKNDITVFQNQLIKFAQFQKQRIDNGEISESTLRNYFKSIKLYCHMNDIVAVNWKKIGKGIPAARQVADDRAPTVEEIKKLIEYHDIRVKVVALVMASSGIRIGSWDYLKWKHIIPIRRESTIVAAKLIARNTKVNNKEYFTFITPEAYHVLKEYMDFRALHGETITGESPLIRNQWMLLDKRHGHHIGMASIPVKLTKDEIRNLVHYALLVQGIRSKLNNPQIKRHEFKVTHGFRKFFETQCQKSGMNHNNIKLLMSHSLGESSNYYRPREEELLEDYLKAVNLLTINEENRLKTENAQLKVRLSDIEKLQYQVNEIKKLMNI